MRGKILPLRIASKMLILMEKRVVPENIYADIFQSMLTHLLALGTESLSVLFYLRQSYLNLPAN